MVLEMYLNNKLVDSLPLSLAKISNDNERMLYIQGAINHLLEIWEDSIKEQQSQPNFYIRTTSFDNDNDSLLT